MNESIKALLARNERTMVRGRFRRRQKLIRLQRSRESDAGIQSDFTRLVDEIDKSTAQFERRVGQVPAVRLDGELPIAEAADQIERAIRDHQVVVVTGETGSGKSTQLPLIMLRAGLATAGYIGHTQPRRIAARGIAQRIAQQLNSPLGRFAGFKIRFADQFEPDAYIKLMTDGVLLAETQSDRFLEQYQAIIIDEAHERSLNIDFILGYFKQLLPKRPDLKVVITSATIDAKRFAEFFEEGSGVVVEMEGGVKSGAEPPPWPSPQRSAGGGNEEAEREAEGGPEPPPWPSPQRSAGGGNEEAEREAKGGAEPPPWPSPQRSAGGGKVPVIEVAGRTYPVEIRFASANEQGERGERRGEEGRDDEQDAVVDAVQELMDEGPGDVLVFLPTEFDIRSTAKQLRGALVSRGDRQTEILPLYARLTTEQQNLVFAPHRARRIVLATNVAESSITVPGIRYVVDTGTARISRYAPRSKVQRLPIEAVSRASADQRAGRCGRVGPGICVRLFSEDDYAKRAHYTTPEIRRTNLASAILQIKSLRLGEIEDFPFLDPPSRDAIRDGYDTLFEIQAIDHDRHLTDVGKTLSRLPTDPRIGRILLAADEHDCLNEVAIIAAGLETPDPRLRPLEQAARADELHAQWSDPGSDFLTLLNLFDFYQRLKGSLSRSQLVRACQQNFLSHHHLREWVDVHRQLQAMTQELGWRIRPRRGEGAAIHRALLAGFLSGIALRQDRNQYQGAGGLLWQIWPGSALAQNPPQWIVAAELVETHRRYGRIVAQIQPQWIEPLAEHLMAYEYDEPHWSEPRQSCLAFERATLHGLPVVAKRLVPYAPIDPAAARRVFIDEGLVAGKLRSKFAFHAQNQRLREQVQRWAAKTRERKFVVDDWVVGRFYDERLPKEATDLASLENCLRGASGLEERLRMSAADLLQDLALPSLADFPDSLDIGGMALKLEYRFEPGGIDDGINVDVPIAALPQLSQRQLNWLVPGWVFGLIEELIRCLPKSLRRSLVPVPDTARRVAAAIPFGSGEVHDVVARQLSKLAQTPIRPADFQLDQLPPHVRMNVRAIGDGNKVVAQSRDLAELRRQFAPTAGTAAVGSDVARWNKSGLATWDFGDIPQSIAVQRGGVDIPLFPTLRDDGESVSLILAESERVAEWHFSRGVARLFTIANRKGIKSHVDWLPEVQGLATTAAAWIAPELLRQKLGDVIARVTIGNSALDIRTQSAFEKSLSSSGGPLAAAAQEVGVWVRELARELHQARLGLESASKATQGQLRGNVERQLAELFGRDFPHAVAWAWLQQYPRYLAAIRIRVEKAASGLKRDQQAAAEVEQQWSRLQKRQGAFAIPYPMHAGLVEVRWLIEELRVSLFAQQLGTRVPVSSKRIEKLWEAIEAEERK